MKSIDMVITGATGFIARSIIRCVLKKGYNICAVIRPGSLGRNFLTVSSNLKIIELPMDQYESLGEVIGAPCNYYLSFAWDGTRGSCRNDLDLQMKNYNRSVAAFKSITAIGCKTLVTAGSQAEYGAVNGRVNESIKCEPVTEYGKKKLDYFLYAKDACEKQSIRIIEPRFFSVYGDGDFEGSMIMTILKKMLNNEDCLLTECIQLWDYIHVNDAAQFIVELMENENAAGVFNIGSGDVKQLKDFIDIMYKLTRSDSKLEYGAIPYPDTGIVSINPDISKLQNIVGNTCHTSFVEGISKLISLIKNNNSINS